MFDRVEDIANLVPDEVPKKEVIIKKIYLNNMINSYHFNLINKFKMYLKSDNKLENEIPKNYIQVDLDKGEITEETAKKIISKINDFNIERRLRLVNSGNKLNVVIITRPEGFDWMEDYTDLPF